MSLGGILGQSADIPDNLVLAQQSGDNYTGVLTDLLGTVVPVVASSISGSVYLKGRIENATTQSSDRKIILSTFGLKPYFIYGIGTSVTKAFWGLANGKSGTFNATNHSGSPDIVEDAMVVDVQARTITFSFSMFSSREVYRYIVIGV